MGATWHIRNEHILDHMFRLEELKDLTEQPISLEALEVKIRISILKQTEKKYWHTTKNIEFLFKNWMVI